MKPVLFYHCVSRLVDRRFTFMGDCKERFLMIMRAYENFTGCRVAPYCLMCNHIHLLLEVPSMPEDGFSDAEPANARESGMDRTVLEIHGRFTRWFNRTHQRSGNPWENAFKSVIVEDGEAVGGGARGNGTNARAGLVRALRAHLGGEAEGRGIVELEGYAERNRLIRNPVPR